MEGKEMKPKMKKGFWKPEEDLILKQYVEVHGEGNWTVVAKNSGLKRSAKSCRLRWKNYLRPNIKRGMMSEDEKDLIIRLHKLLGNRWSLIAGRLPGRTDNEVKNFWNTHLNKKLPKGQNTNLLSPGEEKHKLPNSETGNLDKSAGDMSRTEREDDIALESWIEDMKNSNYDIKLPWDSSDITPFFYDNEIFMPTDNFFPVWDI